MPELSHNPDVLTCLANLSNDEVFTPPEIANSLLDMLPSELWSDPNIRVLDPACKSGVFLREIAKRLNKGLKDKIPNLQERIDHIFHKQLYGFAITELTGHLSRRSVYCSKNANSKYSISEFRSEHGNILYSRINHLWKGDKCIYCGASKDNYDRSDEFESYAYRFIHLNEQKLKELIEMKFDLIISNPPYQLSDGGAGASAKPIYNLFIEQAKKLNPRYIAMIIPARWYTGGKNLDSFREEMIHDKRIKELHDFSDASECFSGVDIKGGVCYFLWDKNYNGLCDIYHYENKEVEYSKRYLVEPGDSIFIRRKIFIEIKNRVWNGRDMKSLETITSPRKPYGFCGDVFASAEKYHLPKMSDIPLKDGYRLLGLDGAKRAFRYLPPDYPIPKRDLLEDYKIFITRNWGNGDLSDIPTLPFMARPYDMCTETFIQIGPFKNMVEEQNAYAYIHTKFFRALVFIRKQDQGAAKAVYHYVPLQDFSINSDINWTKSIDDIDKQLYRKYGLDKEEIDFIESMIKPMDIEEERTDV